MGGVGRTEEGGTEPVEGADFVAGLHVVAGGEHAGHIGVEGEHDDARGSGNGDARAGAVGGEGPQVHDGAADGERVPVGAAA